MSYSIIIFGQTGMLGTYIYNYLTKMNQIPIIINRNTFDVLNGKLSDLKLLLQKQQQQNKQIIVINCIGLIPQRKVKDEEDYEDNYIKINSIFPKYLSIICSEFNYKLIHITTDCVFSGNTFPGSYNEQSEKDELGIYGLSKSFGEDIKATIIRTSIIGEQNNTSYLSLLEWVKSNKNKSINGYTNHYWNGVTCLELSKIIYNIIITNNFWQGIKHVYSNVVSKYELLNYINEIYNLNINIIPVTTAKINNKELSGEIKCNKTIKIQILEMKNNIN
jgi:dTDP-4-dehydrorhamnose reductase